MLHVGRRFRWVGNVALVGRGQVKTGFLCVNLRERDHLGDKSVDGRIILRWIFRNGMWGVHWIELAQVRDRWRALVNAIMNLQVQ
jgi:hypothetical protein